MRPVSAAWDEIIAGPHRVAVVARVYDMAGVWTDLPVVDGSVTLDSTAAVRGRCDLTLEGTDWVPLAADDRLAPYGNEINLRRGIYLPDGSTETVSLGWFGIEDVDVTDDGGLETKVTGLDRANRLSLAKFEEPFEIPAGVTISEGILLVAQLAWPDVPYDPALPGMTAWTISRGITPDGDDRWEFMQGLAKAVGMVLYFDGDGVLTLKPYADAGTVATFREGEGGVLLTASRGWSRTNSFNRVIATGENTDENAVYRAVATDDNPLSPTYYYGPFGKVPRFYTSTWIKSNVQAQDAAAAVLAQEIGTASNVSFGIVPNPALEPEDTVKIVRVRAGIDEEHILDSVTIGLSADESMSGTTRERLVQV